MNKLAIACALVASAACTTTFAKQGATCHTSFHDVPQIHSGDYSCPTLGNKRLTLAEIYSLGWKVVATSPIKNYVVLYIEKD